MKIQSSPTQNRQKTMCEVLLMREIMQIMRVILFRSAFNSLTNKVTKVTSSISL